jgi:hypothetical protein
MFEVSIFCVIALAIGYWAVLWRAGRRDDVLHGDFVEGNERPEPTATQLPATQLPATQISTTQISTTQISMTQAPSVRPASAERLQSLLTAIKQDLKDAAQI